MIFGAASAVVRLPRCRVQDIDNEDDWQLAQYMFEILKHEAAGSSGQ